MSGALRGVEVVSLDLNGTLVTRGYADYFWLELVPRAYAERWGLSFDEARRAVAAIRSTFPDMSPIVVLICPRAIFMETSIVLRRPPAPAASA